MTVAQHTPSARTLEARLRRRLRRCGFRLHKHRCDPGYTAHGGHSGDWRVYGLPSIGDLQRLADQLESRQP